MRGAHRAKTGLQRLVEKALFRRLVFWRGPAARRHVALTFDDGPDEAYTPRVLRILADNAAKGTFFVLGRSLLRTPSLLRQIIEAGHEVGIHGYDHSRQGLPDQMRKTLQLLSSLGVRPGVIRPPAGHVSVGLLLWAARHRMPICLWSLDLQDSMRHEGKRSVRPSVAGLSAGDVVLFHDDNPVCLAELPGVLESARDRKLLTVTVSELLHP
jgi:peptidoglycan/xylan/chitin deacetylase (PgdA/CDA1 family)